MGDHLEARISAIENIQEEFGHDIREMKEQLVRLTSLFKDHIKAEIVHPRGPSPLSNQQVPRPLIQTTSYLPCGISPQLVATNAHNSAYLHGEISTYRSTKQLKR